MSYLTYKIIHLSGVFMVLIAFGAYLLNGLNGGPKKFPNKKWPAITHGLGLFISLFGGFGLMAKLALMGSWPLWIWAKMAVWIYFGFAIAILRRSPTAAKVIWFTTLLVGLLAITMANLKPISF